LKGGCFEAQTFPFFVLAGEALYPVRLHIAVVADQYIAADAT